MPRMSDTMEEGNIVGWMKKEGDPVEPGDLLAEIETDKATMEFESLWEGVLLHIAVKEGAVPVEGVIAVIGQKEEDWRSALQAAQAAHSGNGTTKPKPTEAVDSGNTKAGQPAAAEPSIALEAPGETQRIKASPLARSMAKGAGVDISEVQGSGDQGRIVKKDIEAYLEETKNAPVPAPATSPTPSTPEAETKTPAIPAFTFSGEGDSYENIPVSQMRKIIARRLGESKFSAPHFYLTIEINMAKIIKLRRQLNEVAPTKISFNDLVVKACAKALKLHPEVNVSWMGDAIRRYKNVHIGVAVAVDEGLLVPVIRHADLKTLSQINVEVKALAEKARNRKLQPDEMGGNTFTISNLGMLDIEEFTAILNPPDACILAVGAIIEKPVVKNGKLKVGNRMKVTMSCDHRVVDGATGAKFLQTLKGILEEPVRLLV